MSLSIDVDLVTDVMIGNQWFAVHHESFTLDSYEYLWSGFDGLKVADLHSRPNDYGGTSDPKILHGGGRSGVCATGFSFETTLSYERTDSPVARMLPSGKTIRIAGPLTAVQAVAYRESAEERRAGSG